MSNLYKERAQSATRSRAAVDLRQQIDQRRIPNFIKRPKSSPANARRSVSRDNSLLLSIDGASIELAKKDKDVPGIASWHFTPSIAELALASSYLASSSFYTQEGAADHEEAFVPIERPLSPHAGEKPSKLAEICAAVDHGEDVPDDLTTSDVSAHDVPERMSPQDEEVAMEQKAAMEVEKEVPQAPQMVKPSLPSGERFFLDLWLQRHGSTALDADPMNIALLCQLQADEAAARQQLFDERESQVPEDVCVSRYHHKVGVSAMDKLDVLIKTLGERYPLLVDLRNAILPLIVDQPDRAGKKISSIGIGGPLIHGISFHLRASLSRPAGSCAYH